MVRVGRPSAIGDLFISHPLKGMHLIQARSTSWTTFLAKWSKFVFMGEYCPYLFLLEYIKIDFLGIHAIK